MMTFRYLSSLAITTLETYLHYVICILFNYLTTFARHLNYWMSKGNRIIYSVIFLFENYISFSFIASGVRHIGFIVTPYTMTLTSRVNTNLSTPHWSK